MEELREKQGKGNFMRKTWEELQKLLAPSTDISRN